MIKSLRTQNKLELSPLDYMTIDDLCELGRYQKDVPLFAILMSLFAALREGSLCLNLSRDVLISRFRDFSAHTESEQIAGDFLSNLAQGKYENIIAVNRADAYLPLVIDAAEDRTLLYFQKFYFHETRLKEQMEKFLQAEISSESSDVRVSSLIEDIFSEPLTLRISKDEEAIRRDTDQVDAIKLSLQSQFSIISGGPGTGKTSLMVNILRCLLRSGIPADDIIMGAPTGRAAQRMTQAVQTNIDTVRKPSHKDTSLLNLRGSTLHKILRYRRRGNDFYYRESNPLPVSAIILDEVSMVDVVMMEKFLQAVNPRQTKLVFLGDKDQLPSVEAGAVFAEMIPDGKKAERFRDRLITLRTCYRSGENLTELAKQVNRGRHPEYRPLDFDAALSSGEDHWGFVKAENADTWREHLRRWAKYQYLTPHAGRKSFRELIARAEKIDAGQLCGNDAGRNMLYSIFQHVERARILSLIRKGIYGTTGINRMTSEYLRRQFNAPAKGDIFSGALIIITRNDYSKKLFNGDVGLVIRDAKATYRAFFQVSGSYESFPADILPPHELAFAMTVHKSQGSEFDDVLLVLPDDEAHRLLSREIIYTGITRAKKRVILYGRQRALHTALERKIERESGFMW